MARQIPKWEAESLRRRQARLIGLPALALSDCRTLRPKVLRQTEKWHRKTSYAGDRLFVIHFWPVANSLVLESSNHARRGIQRLCDCSLYPPTNPFIAGQGRKEEPEDIHHFPNLLGQPWAVRLALVIGLAFSGIPAPRPETEPSATGKLSSGIDVITRSSKLLVVLPKSNVKTPPGLPHIVDEVAIR